MCVIFIVRFKNKKRATFLIETFCDFFFQNASHFAKQCKNLQSECRQVTTRRKQYFHLAKICYFLLEFISSKWISERKKRAMIKKDPGKFKNRTFQKPSKIPLKKLIHRSKRQNRANSRFRHAYSKHKRTNDTRWPVYICNRYF